LLLVYIASYVFVPPLVRASIAMSAVAAACSAVWWRRRMELPLWGLLLLALPLMPSLNFYLGYPLRVGVGAVASALLQMNGFGATREGTMLLWNGQQVSIDAPCSGIRMLWTGLYLACALAAFQRMNAGRTVMLAALALGIVMIANVLRATALFYVEAGIVPEAQSAHSLIGITTFVFAAVAIAGAAIRMRPVADANTARDGVGEGFLGRAQGPDAGERVGGSAFNAYGALLVLCVVAAGLPLLGMRPASRPVTNAPAWPTHFEGKPLRELPLGAVERRFAADFPGRIGRFSDGEREIIIRWVAIETRRLHPASDCFRGVGYSIAPRPLHVDPEGSRWGTFLAIRGSQRLEVRERIYDGTGHQWTDVSSWYWAATTGRSLGPWWAVTVASNEQAEP
jgi:exosortase/archaeosortase family protein